MDNPEPFAIPLKDLIGATVIRLLDGHKYTIKGLAKPHEESTTKQPRWVISSQENKRLHQIETVLFRGDPLGGTDEEE